MEAKSKNGGSLYNQNIYKLQEKNTNLSVAILDNTLNK